MTASDDPRKPWDASDLELQGNEPSSVSTELPWQAHITMATSAPYGLRHDEHGIFEEGWNLNYRIARFGGDQAQAQAFYEASVKEVNAATPRLMRAIQGKPTEEPGHSFVRRMPLKGQKYVVFSDHHVTYSGHRTNFFGQRSNLATYAEALRQYDEAGFTVIENGDVEDLIFCDPAYQPDEARLRMDMSLDELEARRLEVRLKQLQWILSDPANASMVEAARRLDASGRLVRLAGNHDYDEQRPNFLAVLRKFYPNLHRPSDYLFLEDEDQVVRFAIMHGHQWDPHCQPKAAPVLGETISETLGLYTQGPDRTWRWTADDVMGWALGTKPFLNQLVVEPANYVHVLEQIVARIVAHPLSAKRNPHETLAGSLVDGTLQVLIEELAGQNIGWDYFLHDFPLTAVIEEVLTGDRFFKFRLLDEEAIRQSLLATFGQEGAPPRPTLVLGHSHEVRFNAQSPVTGKAFDGYINTGSVGRWENLMWGLEVVDGEATLVSWSRESLPAGPVQRRAWRPFMHHSVGQLQASTTPTPVP